MNVKNVFLALLIAGLSAGTTVQALDEISDITAKKIFYAVKNARSNPNAFINLFENNVLETIILRTLRYSEGEASSAHWDLLQVAAWGGSPKAVQKLLDLGFNQRYIANDPTPLVIAQNAQNTFLLRQASATNLNKQAMFDEIIQQYNQVIEKLKNALNDPLDDSESDDENIETHSNNGDMAT